MHEEWKIMRANQRRNAQTRPKSKRVGGFEWEEGVWEVKRQFLSREQEKWDLIFTLKLFKENVSRWIEDLSRFCRALILNRFSIHRDTFSLNSFSAKIISHFSRSLNRNCLFTFQTPSYHSKPPTLLDFGLVWAFPIWYAPLILHSSCIWT